MAKYELILGDCIESLKGMPGGSVQMCVTSPPYFGLRDYGNDGQIGLEATPEAYAAKLVEVFAEVRRVLRDDGTLWLNLGDSYYNYRPGNYDDARPHSFGGERENSRDLPSKSNKRLTKLNGYKEKDLIGVPWMTAFALRAEGWYLRQEIIWHKPNPMPESVKDRPTRAHEQIFLFSKSRNYFYDAEAVREENANPERKSFGRGKKIDASRKDADANIRFEAMTANGRNRRSVWTIPTSPYRGAHFATFPPALVEPCILAGSKAGDIVLDPFNGSGTTGAVAVANGRDYIGLELNPDYLPLAHERIGKALAETAQKSLFGEG